MADNAPNSYVFDVVPRHRYNAVLIGAEGQAGRVFQEQILHHENWWHRIQLIGHITTRTEWQTVCDAYQAAVKLSGNTGYNAAGRDPTGKTILGSTHLFFVDEATANHPTEAGINGIEIITSLEEMEVASRLGRLLTTPLLPHQGIIIGCAQHPSHAFSELVGEGNILLDNDPNILAADEMLENALRFLPKEPAMSQEGASQ